MALEGASANLGPEAAEWVATVERMLLDQQKQIETLTSQLQAVRQ